MALFTFEGRSSSIPPTIPDLTGGPVAQITEETTGGAAIVAGRCGSALLLPSKPPHLSPKNYAVIPDSPNWDLSLGSVSMWVRFDEAPGRTLAILSRIAWTTLEAGHLKIERQRDGVITARLDGNTGSMTTYMLCSTAPVAGSGWHHLLLNIGPPEAVLFVDGVKAAGTGSYFDTCGVTGPRGIAGNDNPWVIGADANLSTPGTTDFVDSPLNGAVDHLRISSVRLPPP